MSIDYDEICGVGGVWVDEETGMLTEQDMPLTIKKVKWLFEHAQKHLNKSEEDLEGTMGRVVTKRFPSLLSPPDGSAPTGWSAWSKK